MSKDEYFVCDRSGPQELQHLKEGCQGPHSVPAHHITSGGVSGLTDVFQSAGAREKEVAVFMK